MVGARNPTTNASTEAYTGTGGPVPDSGVMGSVALIVVAVIPPATAGCAPVGPAS